MLIEKILKVTEQINQEIQNDFQLWSGCTTGHSFLTTKSRDIEETDWFKQVIPYEFKPLSKRNFSI